MPESNGSGDVHPGFTNFLSNGGLNNTATWIFRLFLIIAFLWARGTFVDKEKYDADTGKRLEEWIDLGKKIQHLSDLMDVGQLKDHEERIRAIEKEMRSNGAAKH